MLTHNDQRWPLALLRFDGPTDPDTERAWMRTVGQWLDRDTPFVILIEQHSAQQAASATPRAVRDARNRWSRANRPRISRLCRGVAFVGDSSARLRVLRPLVHLLARPMLGCPVRLFDLEHRDRAERWLLQRLDT